MEKLKNLPKKNIIIICAIIACILLISVLAVLYINSKKDNNKIIDTSENNITPEVIIPEKKLTIIDENSKSRPYAVMINNHATARAHHAGLQDAYIIYELIVEGGITRYMALFKDKDTEKIGSVRSSRHYFLDYAMENDAMYVHWGWSPQAQSDISSYKINNINGLIYEGSYFYRDRSLNVSLEHTGFTKMELLKKAAEKLKYRTTSDEKTLLNYSVDSLDLTTYNSVQKADEITIRYSNSIKDKYIYDEENKVYKRYVNDKAHTDDVTKKQYTFKNIITYQVSNSTISGDNKGRQDFNNVGSGTGYYISEGYAVKINWKKDSRSAKTIYTLEDQTPLKVNDGNTFIQIQPKGQQLTITGNEKNITE